MSKKIEATNKEEVRVDPKTEPCIIAGAFPENGSKLLSNELMVMQVLLMFSSESHPLNRGDVQIYISALFGVLLSEKSITLAWNKIVDTYNNSEASWFVCGQNGKKGYWMRLKNASSSAMTAASVASVCFCRDLGSSAYDFYKSVSASCSNDEKAKLRAAFQSHDAKYFEMSNYFNKHIVDNELKVILEAIANKKALYFKHKITNKTIKTIYVFSPYKIYMKNGSLFVLGGVESLYSHRKENHDFYIARIVNMEDVRIEEDEEFYPLECDDPSFLYSPCEDLFIAQPAFLREGRLDFTYGSLSLDMFFEGVVDDYLLNIISANFGDSLLEKPLIGIEDIYDGGHHIVFYGQKELILGLICTNIDHIYHIKTRYLNAALACFKGFERRFKKTHDEDKEVDD